jgi:hypothetical protein
MSVIEELHKDNLCTYFVLPLLRLNRFNFTGSNFISSYLTKDGARIAIQVYDVNLIMHSVYTHPGYERTFTRDGYHYLVFRIAAKWRRDVESFIHGKFSLMSEGAKTTIYRYSGLNYQSQKGGKIVTDGRLLALERHACLRDNLIREYEIELGPDDELLSVPTDRSFIEL